MIKAEIESDLLLETPFDERNFKTRYPMPTDSNKKQIQTMGRAISAMIIAKVASIWFSWFKIILQLLVERFTRAHA